MQAGLAAEAAAAPSSAERHYERALELWDDAPEAAADSPLDRGALLRRAAETAHLSGDYARGIALIGEALAGVDAGAEPLRASSLLEFLGYCRIAGPDSEGAAAVDAARVEPVSPELARALTGMSLVQSGQGHYQDAIAIAEEGRRAAVQVGAPGHRGTRAHRARMVAVQSRPRGGRAGSPGVRHRGKEVASAVATASELVSRIRSAARARIDELAVTSAEVVTAEADWAWLRPGESGEVARWRDAVGHWDALCFPYPAAHARWRLSHALFSRSGPSAEASQELRSALAAADALGAKALARQIRELGARARVDLEPAPSDGPPGAREPTTPGTPAGLSARERQVLELLAEGLTNRRIAETLFITEKTVSAHVTHILEKLQVTNRSQAGAIARSHGKAPAEGEVTRPPTSAERGKIN